MVSCGHQVGMTEYLSNSMLFVCTYVAPDRDLVPGGGIDNLGAQSSFNEPNIFDVNPK